MYTVHVYSVHVKCIHVHVSEAWCNQNWLLCTWTNLFRMSLIADEVTNSVLLRSSVKALSLFE